MALNSVTRSTKIKIVNPLPTTLAHYQKELITMLSDAAPDKRVEVLLEVGDRLDSTPKKIISAVSIVCRRWRYSRSEQSTFVIIWPLFGYLDVLTWLLVARNNNVVIIYHDPLPLRKQIGFSRLARTIFSRVAKATGIRALCHTQIAKNALLRETRIESLTAGHPLIRSRPAFREYGNAPAPMVRGPVTVLGQFKAARSLEPLVQISGSLSGRYDLRIVGKGWPAVSGWTVIDEFIDEDRFDSLVAESSCVVIPYDHFFQSGVAVRCLESRIPVVAPRHEHIEALFGVAWAGLVDPQTDWVQAIIAVTGESLELDETVERAYSQVRDQWEKLFSTTNGNQDVA